MVCNALRKVRGSYKALKIKKGQEVPEISFKETSSIHYCARTFTLKKETLSLFSINKRIKCSFRIGPHQEKYLNQGKIKEGELIRRGKEWFFNLVIELPEVPLKKEGTILGVDLGENNSAVTSNGTIYGGGKLKAERDRFLNRRKKLQSNGSKASKRCLKKTSGKERRRVKETNHCISKALVEEALLKEAKIIALEDLKNIRKRIKGNKRMRTRLHRWPWRQLQCFIEYKAQNQGIEVVYVEPQYSSLTCSRCKKLGIRQKHLFKCLSCGSYQHSDRNAAINHCKLAESVVSARAPVNVPMVAATALATSSFL
ncbi:putative transposase [Candidatus Neptunochlamydia vexilliferae]|uniref:Transposase n=2 Tax=Candidatus Neptunichlamydia vexilliferae TaxID=1651774 RepID=A0ABS0AXJ2_9BACT|nr:putative transposase [Candidatus Neptunochlamydia vexilliferae]